MRVWQERGALNPTVNWDDIRSEEHAAGFTVAKIARLDLLARMYETLTPVIESGGTYEQWKREILPTLQKAGWWGVVQDKALTGTDDAIVVNDRRLRNIYRTNIRMSIAAGRWRKFQREKELFPYLRYMSDHFRKHPRLNHQSWHGIILPIDHPAWQWLFPPNGWGCNCKVEQVSESRMRANGWTVSEAPDPGFSPFVTASGRVIDVANGVAPGFSYNPGTAHLQVLAERLLQTLERAMLAGLDDAARMTLRETVEDEAFIAFATAPEVRMPVALLDQATAASWGISRRLLLLDNEAIAAGTVEEVAVIALRLLNDLAARAIIVARNDDGLTIWYEVNGGAAFRAIVRIGDSGLGRVVDIRATTLDDAAAESADLDIIFQRAEP